MMIGAGGLQVPAGGVFFNAGGNKESVRLMANQTWSDPTAETTRKRLGIGNAADTTFMTAADGVDALTVNGWLNLWLCSSANDLQNVTVCIEAPAVLKLPQQNDAHIRAKKLVFSGVGDFIDFGGTSTSQDWNKKTCVNIAVIDNEHLAESVELADGAGFSVTDASWELDDLTVSGTAGSTVSGSLTFPQAVNKITFATDGARLTFDTVNREGEVAAGFELAGPGTLCVTDSSALTGVQTVSADSAFEIVCDDAMRFGGTFAGAGTVALSGSGFVYLPEASITEFSGSILVKGGTLVAGVDNAIPEDPVTIAGGTLDLNGKAATVTALFADLASFGGGLAGISAATLPDTLTVKNGQLAGADGKHSYALMNLPDGYPGGLPNLVLKGNDDPEWKLALVNGVLKLKKDSGLILLFR